MLDINDFVDCESQEKFKETYKQIIGKECPFEHHYPFVYYFDKETGSAYNAEYVIENLDSDIKKLESSIKKIKDIRDKILIKTYQFKEKYATNNT